MPAGNPGGGTFINLPDTPATYVGQAGLSAVVNPAENALEFLARTKISTANRTIYIDKGASGANDGTSWTDAFESWADCKTFLTGYVIAHDWTIKVREGATPYRETFDITGLRVWGTLTIEGEYYWNGDCEANAVAGDIVDTGAFGNVAVGDKVYLLDLNGANGRAQDYEVCTVDDVSGAPDRIGTDGAKTATLNWKYTIVRTEVSGSDDGTDGGTARDHCVEITSVDNIYIYGFYLTFSDDNAIRLTNARNCYAYYWIAENCDLGLGIWSHSYLEAYHWYADGAAAMGAYSHSLSHLRCRYATATSSGGSNALAAFTKGSVEYRYGCLDNANRAVTATAQNYVILDRCTIEPNDNGSVATGAYARGNSYIYLAVTTNNATVPTDDSRTAAAGEPTALALDSDAAYIGIIF